LKAGVQLTNKSLLKHLKPAAGQLKEDRNPGAAGTVPAPYPHSLPAPAGMACPGFFDATEPPSPWQTVQETFFSKLFILIQLREQGAESYNVLVHVQSHV